VNPVPAGAAVQEPGAARAEDPGEPVGPDGPGAPAGAPKPDDERGYPVHGSLSTRLGARWTGDDSDFDLRAAVELRAGDPERHDVTLHFAGSSAIDLDGDSGDVFDGIADTYDSSFTGLVYDAYAEVHAVEALPMIRIGRQSDIETPAFLVYDGIRIESREHGDKDVQLGLYGGVSTHYYESSADGDSLFGAYLQARPWTGGRVRLDWTHAEDERNLGTVDDDLYGVSVWQTLSPQLRVQAAYTAITGDSRDVDVRGTWYDVEADFLFQVYYYELFETQKANPLEFGKFFESLFDYFPFRRFGFTASKGITERFRLEGGIDLRDVDDSDDEGAYNRDVQRYHLTAMVDQVFTDDTTVSLTGDVWETDGNHQKTETFGADVTHAFSAETRASIGSYYSKYKIDLLSADEREDVRAYYVGMRKKLTEDLTIRARYEYEDAEEDDFQSVMVRLLWRF